MLLAYNRGGPLIVPYGIETSFMKSIQKAQFPLIVPYGIETPNMMLQ